MRNISNKPQDNTGRLYTFAHNEDAPIDPVAGVIDLVVEEASENDVYCGTTVAPTTVNLPAAQKAKLVKGDRVNLIIPTDATGRTVTWGTNIKAAAATLAIVANGKACVSGIFDGTDLVLR
jgi:hypothetical protein